MDAYEMIESAMRGVHIVPCPACGGVGETLEGTCEQCLGCGVTTINELEVGRDQG